ncbi:hypothetical protein C5S32_00440 [ANME-1 cluster archaeon GoMg1]|nr:hypothetical protein [ANME-1 cluster archaeon GoMg1]
MKEPCAYTFFPKKEPVLRTVLLVKLFFLRKGLC